MDKLTKDIIKKYNLKGTPSLSQIIIATKGKLGIKRKPVRGLSGVAPVAIMTKPIKCPHGRCIMCPTVKNMPQSYTGKEPASRRGLRNKFHPYLQVFNRLEQYMLLGNKPEKVELILMGGNFTSFPVKYQNWFISSALKAMNDFSLDYDKFLKNFELDVRNEMSLERTLRLNKKFLKKFKKISLLKAQKQNEKSKVRCVAICVETRPDYCGSKEIKRMLGQGVTRVELGVQSLYDNVLYKLNRKHLVSDSVKATKLLKDNGYKVGYHMLLGAYGSDFSKDVKMFRELFSNENFRPDALKIYPCMVFKNTKLYKLFKMKKFKPLTTAKAVELINKVKKYIPEYCRVMRVQRDIPSYLSIGVDKTNLREYVNRCRCIRCRQAKEIKGKVILKRKDYNASFGREVFLSFENNDKIVGFLRLRICGENAFVRELHVYGLMTSLGEKGLIQHRGFGKRLLLEAEKIVKKEFKVKKLKVISGVGARMYYKKLKYKLEGTYMVKKLFN